jgi:peptide/nickel transport system permease protein
MTKWQPVILWTDGLAWFGIVLMLILLFASRAQMRAGWQRLWQQPLAVVSMLILLCYGSIGLLDSLHYRVRLPTINKQVQYSITVYSVLDALLTPLRTHNETSYAAPLARRAFSATPERHAGGEVVEVRKPLQLGGHTPPHARTELALRGALYGGITSIGLLLAGVFIIRTLAARTTAPEQHVAPDPEPKFSWPKFPWRSFSLTLLLLSMLIGSTIELAGNFHVFGTNEIGQDVLYDSIKSVRTGLMMGCLATLVTLPLAVGLGLAAGYFGGWVDDLVQYIYTTLNAIPAVLLIAATVLLMQGFIETHPAMFDSTASRSDIRLLFLCVILGMTNWTGLCRILRGETLKLRELDYIQAARAFGVPSWRILWQHLLPNLSHLILISLVMDFSGLVLAEAVLSYIGVGVDPSMHSWGNMINAARLELSRDPVIWWPLTAAFIGMFTLVLAANLFADAVRDAFDPLATR